MIRALVALPDECLSGRWTYAGQERLGEGRWILVVAMQLAKKKDGQIGNMRERSGMQQQQQRSTGRGLAVAPL